MIVASDGSTDATAERARAAGADLVLELPPGGKVAALNAAAEQADRRAARLLRRQQRLGAGRAARAWSRPSPTRAVGYVCGQVRFVDAGGDNLEGAYWRYEMAVREMESALGGVTAGNGAIYAVRRDAYIPLAASGSHDLSFPFALAKRGLRSLYAPAARAEEKMVPTMEGEFARKRRMMVGLWDIVVGEGMLSPRGYSPLFAFELASHRLLRYLSPLLHLVVLVANVALLGHGWVYTVTFVAPAGPARRGAARPLAAAGAAARRPLLRDDDRLDRRRPLGPLAPRRRRALGEGRRAPADAARPRPPHRRRSPWSCSRPSCWSRRSRSSSAAAAR